MATRRQYMKRQTEFVVAVQLDLETTGFTYKKWDDTQTCKRGDWIVNNNGDTYTVDSESFARTYKSNGPGTYREKRTGVGRGRVNCRQRSDKGRRHSLPGRRLSRVERGEWRGRVCRYESRVRADVQTARLISWMSADRRVIAPGYSKLPSTESQTVMAGGPEGRPYNQPRRGGSLDPPGPTRQSTRCAAPRAGRSARRAGSAPSRRGVRRRRRAVRR